MLSKQPDQSAYILNKVIDKANFSTGGGGGGDIEVVQTTGTSTTAVMSQNATTVALGGKVSAVAGKGLSSNDFTNAYKLKLDSIVIPNIIEETLNL